MSKYPLLIEAGCEDLPPADVATIRETGLQLFKEILSRYRVNCYSAELFTTPRRIAVRGLVDFAQSPEKKEVKGPPYDIAVKDGTPTRAGVGFADKMGVGFDKLAVKETPRGKYMHFTLEEKGRPVRELLGDITSEFLTGLEFPVMMSWPGCPFRFPRPIRWVLAVMGSSSVKFELGNLKTGKSTRGHYIFADKKIKIKYPGEYEKVLKLNYVIADPAKRREALKTAAARPLKYTRGYPDLKEELLEELVGSVEFPTGIKGSFPEQYLNLPREVIEACLVYHQRFFPVTDRDGNILNNFIGIRDGISQGLDEIRAGYEKVLVARLKDAEFFLGKDREKPLEYYASRLDGIEFTRGLGTLKDKTRRVSSLCRKLCLLESVPEGMARPAARIAALAKADLTTLMVGEFPELEGTVGKIYAGMDGEPEEVSEGIQQHYSPRTARDPVPDINAAAAVGICDRLDTLCGNIAVGVTATGSQDPFGLRRVCRGMLRIAVEKGWSVDFGNLGKTSLGKYGRGKFPSDALEKVTRFISEQAVQYAEERFPHDVARCAAAAGTLDPCLLFERAGAVEKIKNSPGFDSLIAAFRRTGNILRQAREKKMKIPSSHNPSKLREKPEKELGRLYARASGKVDEKIEKREYYQALRELASLREAVDSFFDQVLVMDPDEGLRKNRLALINDISRLFAPVGDISLLELKL